MTISEKYVVWDDEEHPILFIERPARLLASHLLAMLATVAVFIATFILALVIGLGLLQSVQPKWIGVVGARGPPGPLLVLDPACPDHHRAEAAHLFLRRRVER